MNQDFFKNNRAKLCDKLDDVPIILTAFCEMQRSNDASWKFEQDADFWYMSGIEAADWHLVINGGESTLIAPDIAEVSQIFNGSLDAISAGKISGVDQIINAKQGAELITKLAKKSSKIYTILPEDYDFGFAKNPSQNNLVNELRNDFDEIVDCRAEIAKLRAIKTREEIMMMRRAINLTAATFSQVKNELQNYVFEYEAQAKFSYEFEKVGATHAYDPIIASGGNAVTLHYHENRTGIAKNELILMDVGARYGNYSADITRTYAVGEVSQRAKGVHLAVCEAQTEIINLIKPGGDVREYLEKSDEIMKKSIAKLGLKGDFRKFYPHAISHGLGIDVHDPLGRPKTFQPGMILTVEPGIYIADENIGVRIEDDILVTENGCENLSGRLPRDL